MRLLPGVVLALGVTVGLLSLASQVMPLPLPQADFASLAVLGLVVALVALAVSVGNTGARRAQALVGLALALTPVVMLVYFLSISEG